MVPEALRPSPLCGPLAGVWGRGHTLSTGAHGALGETAWTWSTTTQHGQGRDGAAGAWATGAAFALRGPAWEKAPQTRGRPSRVWPDEYELIGDRHVGRRRKGTVQQWEVLERHVGPECRGRQPPPPGRPRAGWEGPRPCQLQPMSQGPLSFCKVQTEPREGAHSPCGTQRRELGEHSAFGLTTVAAAIGVTPLLGACHPSPQPWPSWRSRGITRVLGSPAMLPEH